MPAMTALISSISFIAWIVIEAMVLLNPSETVPVSPMGLAGYLFFAASALSAFLLPYLASSSGSYPEKSTRFFPVFFATFIVLMGIAWYAGFSYHRDFFVYTTELVLIYAIIFLTSLDNLDIVRRKIEVYQVISIGAISTFVMWTVWLMITGYAIISRIEPRWIEATGYNIVNGVIGLVLLVSAAVLREKSKRSLYIREGELYLDRRNLTNTLSPQECRIVCLFLTQPGHVLTCRSLIENLRADDLPPGSIPESRAKTLLTCRECVEHGWTASSCSVYRNLKNRISDTKKYLELLQIGTIVPVSENPREIKAEGWALRLFDDVRYGKNLTGRTDPSGTRAPSS